MRASMHPRMINQACSCLGATYSTRAGKGASVPPRMINQAGSCLGATYSTRNRERASVHPRMLNQACSTRHAPTSNAKPGPERATAPSNDKPGLQWELFRSPMRPGGRPCPRPLSHKLLLVQVVGGWEKRCEKRGYPFVRVGP